MRRIFSMLAFSKGISALAPRMVLALRLVVLAGLLGLASFRLPAGAPLPLITFYGMLVDEFGWPYESNIRVEIIDDGKKILTRTLTPAQGRDYNFLVRLPYDSGGGIPYTSDAIVAGDNITLKITAVETSEVLKSTNLIVSFPPGAVLNINLSAGTDSLGDGLPDELRYWIWRNLGLPDAFNPANIRAQDDSDGDGASNIAEYLAGTDPANDGDYLWVAMAQSGYVGVGQLMFYTVPGKTYEVRSSSLASTNSNWQPISFASSPTGSPTNTYAIGTGHFLSLFVPTDSTNKFYRISVLAKTGSSVVP